MARKASTGDTLTRDDANAWLRQFPFPGWTALGFQVVVVLAGNALVLWLLASGRLPGAGLILLVVIEFVLLFALAHLAALPVPRAHWFEPPTPWREQLFLLGFLAVWAGGAYSFTLLLIGGWPDFLAYFHDPGRWHATGLSWALGVTFVLALATACGDWLRYRRRGPPFMPALGLEVASRMLTLIFGAIPFAVPIFAAFIGVVKSAERIIAAARAKRWTAAAATLAAALGGLVLLYTMFVALQRAGVNDWAIGYVMAKCVAELLVVAIPIVMREAAAGR
ncbi:MAG: hypothetical protein LW860_17720 [Xanthomonadaceae bacterium]|jgi:hypothetical protein|nr:hypothetical protein [Xanthomonadaceae bacterium]